MSRNTRRGLRGFTLIEVLVAFAIFALCIGALFELFGDSVQRGSRASDLEIDWLTAGSLLSELRTHPGPWEAETRGRAPRGRDWQIEAVPFDAQTDGKSPWKAYEVTVRVTHAGASSSVELRSIELLGSTP